MQVPDPRRVLGVQQDHLQHQLHVRHLLQREEIPERAQGEPFQSFQTCLQNLTGPNPIETFECKIAYTVI